MKPEMHWSITNFEANMRFYRLKRGWTKRRLGREAGMSHNTITRIELGYRTKHGLSLKSAAIIAGALNVPLGEMVKPPPDISDGELEDMEFEVRSAAMSAERPRRRR